MSYVNKYQILQKNSMYIVCEREISDEKANGAKC